MNSKQTLSETLKLIGDNIDVFQVEKLELVAIINGIKYRLCGHRNFIIFLIKRKFFTSKFASISIDMITDEIDKEAFYKIEKNWHLKIHQWIAEDNKQRVVDRINRVAVVVNS